MDGILQRFDGTFTAGERGVSLVKMHMCVDKRRCGQHTIGIDHLKPFDAFGIDAGSDFSIFAVVPDQKVVHTASIRKIRIAYQEHGVHSFSILFCFGMTPS